MFDTGSFGEWIARAAAAQREMHEVLSKHENSASRVVILEDLLVGLINLPIDIQDYFAEATTCLQYDLLRAAIILSWSGFFHVLLEHTLNTHEVQLRAERPKWRFNDLTELKQSVVECQLLEAIKGVNVIDKSDLKIFQGQLAVRNQCAHPTLYRPSLNSALGYVDDMIMQAKRYL